MRVSENSLLLGKSGGVQVSTWWTHQQKIYYWETSFDTSQEEEDIMVSEEIIKYISNISDLNNNLKYSQTPTTPNPSPSQPLPTICVFFKASPPLP